MKKLILITLLGVISLGYSQSNQNNSIFIKIGASNNTIEDVGLTENTTSPYISIGFNTKGKFSFQSELLFSLYKLDIKNNANEYAYNEGYTYNGSLIRLGLPLIVKQKLGSNFSALVGLTPSLIIINKNKSKIENQILETEQPIRYFNNNTSFSGTMSFGGEYKIHSNFFIEAKYNYSPKFLLNFDDTVIHSTSVFNLHEKSFIQLGLGYYL